ncbi:MAG TPA: CRISPR-associated endonuclease Cas2 [Hydrogenobaculum sp.]|nr:CRISPR-associated endonuclease Cas2 [Hydrogenobaculum sp.]
MKFVICYDIANNKRLQKVSKFLEKRAIRVQYSIFEMEGDKKIIKEIMKDLEDLIDKEQDRIYIFQLENQENNIKRIGKLKDLHIV